MTTPTDTDQLLLETISALIDRLHVLESSLADLTYSRAPGWPHADGLGDGLGYVADALAAITEGRPWEQALADVDAVLREARPDQSRPTRPTPDQSRPTMDDDD